MDCTTIPSTKSEIRNAATAHTARDTWLHFLLNKRFDPPVSVADYQQFDFTVNFQVDELKQLSIWPGVNRSSMNLNFMFHLRHREDPEQRLFVGMMLFTNNPVKYQNHLGVEQHGQVFYRESITRDQPQPGLGHRHLVSRELRDMITTALREANAKQPSLSTNPDDFTLSNFSIGLEGMGHWETECEISNLSFIGDRQSEAAKPVAPHVECDVAMLDRARNLIASRTEPLHSYWLLAKTDAAQAMEMQPEPCISRDALEFHQEAQDQGMAARLLACRWRLEDDEPSGAHAVLMLGLRLARCRAPTSILNFVTPIQAWMSRVACCLLLSLTI